MNIKPFRRETAELSRKPNLVLNWLGKIVLIILFKPLSSGINPRDHLIKFASSNLLKVGILYSRTQWSISHTHLSRYQLSIAASFLRKCRVQVLAWACTQTLVTRHRTWGPLWVVCHRTLDCKHHMDHYISCAHTRSFNCPYNIARLFL